MEWDYVQRFHMNPPPSAADLPRNKNVDIKYQEHKKQVKSIKEHIISTYFDSESVERGWVIVNNEFPYDLNPNIQHLLIWIYPGKDFSDESIIGIIEDYMKNNGHSEYIYFRNILAIRSVLEIDHYHIFVKIPKLGL